jgi:hypothetical protein
VRRIDALLHEGAHCIDLPVACGYEERRQGNRGSGYLLVR